MILRESVERALARAGTKERLKDQGVDPAVYEKARLTVKLDPREASEKETSEDAKNVGVNLAVSGVLFFLIYISIFIYGAFIMRGVLEEKNNRIVEVIISSVKPTTLMLGKIIGIGLVGLTQYAVWGLFAFAITLPGIVGVMGLAGGAIPSIPGGDDPRLRRLLPPRLLPLRRALRRPRRAVQHGAGGAAARDDPRDDAHPGVDDVVLRLQHARTGRWRGSSPSSPSRPRS